MTDREGIGCGCSTAFAFGRLGWLAAVISLRVAVVGADTTVEHDCQVVGVEKERDSPVIYLSLEDKNLVFLRFSFR